MVCVGSSSVMVCGMCGMCNKNRHFGFYIMIIIIHRLVKKRCGLVVKGGG